MKELAAYLLLVLGGNASPSADDITNVLSAGGVKADADEAARVLEAVNGKDLDEVIALGRTKLVSVGSGGGGSAPAAGGAAPAASGAKEEKKEEKKKEEEEEEVGGAGGLFGADDDW